MYLNKHRKKIAVFIILVLLVVGGIALFLYHQSSTKPDVTATPTTKGPSTELPQSTSDKGTGSAAKNTSETSVPKSTNPPEKPTGIFVSNHRPSLSGENLSNQINSVCTTTSGATCTITFTNGSKNVSLKSQETDSGGSTYWTWKLQDYNITEGTWKVTATATMNGKTTSADDSIDLVVSK